jgi:hypothetical protein
LIGKETSAFNIEDFVLYSEHFEDILSER